MQKHRFAAVEERSAKERHRTVLRSVRDYRTAQFLPAFYANRERPIGDFDNVPIKRRADLRERGG